MATDVGQPRITWKNLRNSLVAAFMLGLFWLALEWLRVWLMHLARIVDASSGLTSTEAAPRLPLSSPEMIALAFLSGLLVIVWTLPMRLFPRLVIAAVSEVSFGLFIYRCGSPPFEAVVIPVLAFVTTLSVKPREVSLREALTFAFWTRLTDQRLSARGILGKEIRLPRSTGVMILVLLVAILIAVLVAVVVLRLWT